VTVLVVPLADVLNLFPFAPVDIGISDGIASRKNVSHVVLWQSLATLGAFLDISRVFEVAIGKE
jgi:hypothetical protein